ncbi:MAG: hypothetical protein ABFS08_08425 [Pseudomonadota bacterium]
MPWVRITLFLLAVMVSLGIARYQYLVQTPPLAQASSEPKAITIAPSAVLKHNTYTINRHTEQEGASPLTPRSAMAHLQNQYRLPPDRRFILALLQLQKLAYPEEDAQLEVNYVNNSWQISLNNEVIAHLDELPDFTAAKAMLLRASKRILPSISDFADTMGGQTVQRLDGFSITQAQQHLNKLNQQWSNDGRNISIIKQSVDALARMSWAARELLDNQDEMVARALALLVLGERGTYQPLLREESMLAETMGYNSHAQTLAEQLQQDDPWRLYLLRDEALLSNMAGAADASRDSIDLWLMQLAQKDEKQAWSEWLSHHYRQQPTPIFALQSAYSLRGFYPRTVAIRLMPMMIARATDESQQKMEEWQQTIAQITDDLPLGRLALITKIITTLLKEKSNIHPDQIMARIDKTAKNYSGPFFDHQLYQAYYQGLYFSSLYRLGLHYLDSRSDLGQATQFSHYLGSSKNFGITELSTWYTNLVNAQKNKIKMQALLHDLQAARHIGIATLERTLEELLPRYSFGSRDIGKAIDFLFTRLDSRIDHRYTLANLSRQYLLHFSLSEQLYNSIHRDEPHHSHYLSAWLGKYHNMPSRITQVVSDNSIQPDTRADAAELLLTLKPAVTTTKTLLQQLLNEQPDSWQVHASYIKFLEQQGNFTAAIDIARHWMKHRGEKSDSFDYWKAVIAISRMQQKEGNTDAAWQTIHTITNSMYGGALHQATQVKLAEGDTTGAKQWAIRAIKRYPNSSKAILNMVIVLWQQHEYHKAAQFLHENKSFFSSEDWRWMIGKRFAENFAKDEHGIRSAFIALQQSGLGYAELVNIPPALADMKLYSHAFNTQSELKLNGGGQIQIDVNAYHYLEKSEGRGVAIDWLKGRIPDNMRNFASMIFFSEGEYSLLWDLIPNPENGRHADAVWLYRASALVQGAPLSSDRKGQLIDYYHDNYQNKYDKLGRYILGLSGGDELLKQEMDERTLSETAFYLGLAALNNSQLARAADWFKLSTHYSSTRNGEYRWSYNRLYRWKNAGQSLQVQADMGTLISLTK